MVDRTSLIAAFGRMVASNPDAIAVAGGRDLDESLTYAELEDRSARLAGGLEKLGVRPGEALAVWLPNVVEWVMIELACARLGVMVAPLNTRYRSAEAAHLLRTSQARVLVLPAGFMDIDYLGILSETLGELPAGRSGPSVAPDLRHVVVVDLGETRGEVDVPNGCIPFSRLLSGERAADRSRPDAALNLFVTSGTTGPPKLAVHDQESITGRFESAGRMQGLGPGAAALCVLPLCGVWGLGLAIAALVRGAVCVLLPRFDGEVSVAAIERWGVTHVHGSDTMLRAILEASAADATTLASWSSGNFGNFTGRPGEELVRLAAQVADVRLGGAYGSSECLAMAALWPVEQPIALRAQGGGHLVDAGTQVRTCDPETGELLPPEQPGELLLRGSGVMSHYLNNPEATEAAFNDGWYRTGDLGYVLDERRIVFLARLKDSLRLRGFLVDPQEIEEHLAGHPDVVLAQVVGVDEADGQRAVAFVQRRDGSDADEASLRSYCRGRIADFKIPSRVILVEDFPTVDGPNGIKIQKFALRERATELLHSGA